MKNKVLYGVGHDKQVFDLGYYVGTVNNPRVYRDANDGTYYEGPTMKGSTTIVGFRYLALTLLLTQAPISLAQAPVVVQVSKVQRHNSSTELVISGDVRSVRRVVLGAEVAGLVATVLVEQGDVVREGQPLVQLRGAPTHWQLMQAEAQLQRVQAQLKVAELEVERRKSLLDRELVAVESFDLAIAGLQQAKADIGGAEANVALLKDAYERHSIAAPFNGVITAKPVEQGAWLGEGDAVLTLISLDELRLELAVPQQHFHQLSVGSKVTIDVAGLAKPLEAPISRIIPFADNARNFRVWVAIDNRERRLIPGMAARAILRSNGASAYSMVISSDALIRRPDGRVILWKVVPDVDGGHKVEEAKIEPGPSKGLMTTFRSNQLKPGDRVVVRGNENLVVGQLIAVQE